MWHSLYLIYKKYANSLTNRLSLQSNKIAFVFSQKVHGYLQEASKLTCEYISAVLGNGREYFGLTTSLHAAAPPVWLPHNLIDQLLLELREKSQDSAYHQVKFLDNSPP